MSQPLKLSQLTAAIAQVMQQNFGNKTFWVIAEVSGLKYYAGKNYYFFNLIEKEQDSTMIKTSISATAWSGAVNQIRRFEKITGRPFADNLEVLCCVKVEYHVTYGLKLNLLDIDPSFTLGKLALQREATIARLINENPTIIQRDGERVITFNQLRLLHPVIQRIALLGSPETDGFRDFKHELQNNMFHYYFEIDVFPTRVQGPTAEEMMVEQLTKVAASSINYDVVVLVRGGGADTDMLAYDGYDLNRTIASFPIPVFTGIGHTRNETIADLVAFQSFKTPTKVASFIIEYNRKFEDEIRKCWSDIAVKSLQHLNTKQKQIARLQANIPGIANQYIFSKKMDLKSIENLLNNKSLTFLLRKSDGLNFLKQKMQVVVKNYLEKQNFILNTNSQVLKLVAPEQMLKRGFAIVYQQGQWVRHPHQLKEGVEIETKFYKTTVTSVVKQVNNGKEE